MELAEFGERVVRQAREDGGPSEPDALPKVHPGQGDHDQYREPDSTRRGDAPSARCCSARRTCRGVKAVALLWGPWCVAQVPARPRASRRHPHRGSSALGARMRSRRPASRRGGTGGGGGASPQNQHPSRTGGAAHREVVGSGLGGELSHSFAQCGMPRGTISRAPFSSDALPKTDRARPGALWRRLGGRTSPQPRRIVLGAIALRSKCYSGTLRDRRSTPKSHAQLCAGPMVRARPIWCPYQALGGVGLHRG